MLNNSLPTGSRRVDGLAVGERVGFSAERGNILGIPLPLSECCKAIHQVYFYGTKELNHKPGGRILRA